MAVTAALPIVGRVPPPPPGTAPAGGAAPPDGTPSRGVAATSIRLWAPAAAPRHSAPLRRDGAVCCAGRARAAVHPAPTLRGAAPITYPQRKTRTEKGRRRKGDRGGRFPARRRAFSWLCRYTANEGPTGAASRITVSMSQSPPSSPAGGSRRRPAVGPPTLSHRTRALSLVPSVPLPSPLSARLGRPVPVPLCLRARPPVRPSGPRPCLGPRCRPTGPPPASYPRRSTGNGHC